MGVCLSCPGHGPQDSPRVRGTRSCPDLLFPLPWCRGRAWVTASPSPRPLSGTGWTGRGRESQREPWPGWGEGCHVPEAWSVARAEGPPTSSQERWPHGMRPHRREDLCFRKCMPVPPIDRMDSIRGNRPRGGGFAGPPGTCLGLSTAGRPLVAGHRPALWAREQGCPEGLASPGVASVTSTNLVWEGATQGRARPCFSGLSSSWDRAELTGARAPAPHAPLPGSRLPRAGGGRRGSSPGPPSTTQQPQRRWPCSTSLHSRERLCGSLN